jgi:hypothetical protein
LLLCAAVAAIAATVLTASAGAAPKETKRELLASHDTVARFSGLTAHTCRGLTSLCPDRCGHSGNMASFEIVGYLAYEKPGQYGDPKATEYDFLLEDNRGTPKVPDAIVQAVRELKKGDLVRLTWRHDYVTTTEGGGSASSPERPIVKLEKITQQEADALLKAAGTQPASGPASRRGPAASRPARPTPRATPF